MTDGEQNQYRIIDDPATLEVLCDFIQSLGGTIVNIKRYPIGSAIVNMAIDRCKSSATEVFAHKDTFTVTESDRLLLVDSMPLTDKTQQRAYVRAFIDSMIARGIKSMTFRKTLSGEELLAFLNVLGDKPEDLTKKGPISEQLTAAGVKSVTLDEKVYVALSKDQSVADKDDLARLAKMDQDLVSPDQVKDGMFLNSLLNKIPTDKLNLTDEQMADLKKSINFDKLKDARSIDFSTVGATLATTMEKWSKADQINEEAAGQDLNTVSPEEKEADQRVDQIASTFKEMSKAILEFKQPEIRAKLLNDFTQVVTNFKGVTLAKILSSGLTDGKDINLKDQIIRQISAKKRSAIVDMLFKKYHRLAEGLSATDFNLNLQEVAEGEFVLKKLLRLARVQENKELTDKLQRALGMTQMLSKEANNPQALLVLKIKRMFARGPRTFIEEDTVNNFAELARRLIEVERPDVIRKIIDQMSANFTSEDPAVRVSTVSAFIRVNQEVIELRRPELLNEGFGLLIKHLKQETDPAIYTRIVAAVYADFGKVLDLQDYVLASNIMRALIRQRDECPESPKKQVLVQAVGRMTDTEDTLAKMLEAFKTDNEQTSQTVSKLLQHFPPEKVIHYTLILLKQSEDMRVRKKCLAFVGAYGDRALGTLIEHLSVNNPWYYNRNLINLIGDVGGAKLTQKITTFLGDGDERVRKSAIAALMKFASEESNRALAETFDKQPEPVQKILVQHFGQLKSLAAVSVLIAHLEKSSTGGADEEYLVSIIKTLGLIGSPDATGVLLGYLKKAGLLGLFHKPSEPLMAAAIAALGAIGDTAQLPVVKKYAKHSNPEVARAAQEAGRRLESAHGA